MAWGLRGWRDDFMGQVLHEQYDQRLSGAGSSLVLQPNAHGGVLRLTAVVETGNVRCLANAAASRYMDLDYWETIPR
uniref:Uncharacterized protein n=2 Tax=viral metagenome TaxID=1070528 RepID=A0A6M3MBG5_9ZZZZ